MKIRKFEESDWEFMNNLYIKHNLSVMPKDWYSDCGLVVISDDDNIIAFAFIYFTNSKRIILDDIITNPERESSERFAALQAITKACIYGAKENDNRFIIGYTREKSIMENANKLGWRLIEQPFRCVTLGV